MSEVKERVRQLLDEMSTKGLNLFEDSDFAPSTPENMTVLYRQQDIVSAEEAETMKKLKWLRPRQISMKSDMVGFTQINRVGIVDSEFDNMQPSEMADYKRIGYGDILEDRWLLNAASLVAQEER